MLLGLAEVRSLSIVYGTGIGVSRLVLVFAVSLCPLVVLFVCQGHEGSFFVQAIFLLVPACVPPLVLSLWRFA